MLLLENHLSPHELLRRQHGSYTLQTSSAMNTYNYASIDGFHLSYDDAQQMAQRLRVDMSIIIFNVIRLRGHCHFLLTIHEYYRRNVLHQPDMIIKEPVLSSKQMVVALEFYLQMDGKLLSSKTISLYMINEFICVLVDLFYMKTCSYGGAQPRSDIEGLFCGPIEPEARYSMDPCENLFCLCCYPYNQEEKIHQWPVVDFKSSSTHRFVNGYTTYLNCPAVIFFRK